MIAIELRFDVRDLLLDGIKNGILMLYSGRNIIRLLPLVIDEAMVSSALEKIDKVLTKEEERKNVK